VDAVKATGPAVILDGLAIALGFGVMVMSQVPSNARLGGLVVLSVVVCLFVTLFALPALLTFWQPAALRSQAVPMDSASNGAAPGAGHAVGRAEGRDA
jgi:predicted RND superfamily exporter protein